MALVISRGKGCPFSINYTPGTTGRPKGAVYHYRGAYLNALGEVRLSGYMRPAAAEIVTELPKTSPGKIQKAALRAREWEGRGRRIG